MKARESAIKGRLEELDAKICNDVNLDQHILSEYESLKKELHELYELKGRGAIFRSKKEKNQRNIFSTLRKRTMKKKLFHN